MSNHSQNTRAFYASILVFLTGYYFHRRALKGEHIAEVRQLRDKETGKKRLRVQHKNGKTTVLREQ